MFAGAHHKNRKHFLQKFTRTQTESDQQCKFVANEIGVINEKPSVTQKGEANCFYYRTTNINPKHHLDVRSG